MRNYYFSRFPRIRKSYLDVCSLTERKHHVPILLECDVSESLKKIHLKKDSGEKISLNSWLVKLVGDILAKHHEIAAYVYNDRSFIVFNEIKLLMIMEKTPNGKPMPLGLLIDKPNEMSIPEIKDCLEEAKNQKVGTKHMLVNKSPGVLETFFLLFTSRSEKIYLENHVVVSSLCLCQNGERTLHLCRYGWSDKGVVCAPNHPPGFFWYRVHIEKACSSRR